MPATSSSFKSLEAPCGRVVNGETYEDQDQETLLTQGMDYACGCRSIRHQYHDGAFSRKIVRHDGAVLVDELLSAE
jgi:hypothetical protein